LVTTRASPRAGKAASIPLRLAGRNPGHAVIGEHLDAAVLAEPGHLGLGVVAGGHARVSDHRHVGSVSYDLDCPAWPRETCAA